MLGWANGAIFEQIFIFKTNVCMICHFSSFPGIGFFCRLFLLCWHLVTKTTCLCALSTGCKSSCCKTPSQICFQWQVSLMSIFPMLNECDIHLQVKYLWNIQLLASTYDHLHSIMICSKRGASNKLAKVQNEVEWERKAKVAVFRWTWPDYPFIVQLWKVCLFAFVHVYVFVSYLAIFIHPLM